MKVLVKKFFFSLLIFVFGSQNLLAQSFFDSNNIDIESLIKQSEEQLSNLPNNTNIPEGFDASKIKNSDDVIDLLKQYSSQNPELQNTLSEIDQLQNLYGTEIDSGYIEKLSVSAEPSKPKAGELVTLKINHNSLEYNEAKISWYVNGELRLSEIGTKTFSFRVGDNGETTTVQIKIEKPSGNLTRTYKFTPADVEIIYEAGGYTHPFYRGSPLFTKQGFIKFIAYPEIYSDAGKLIDPSKLTYTWYLNGDKVPSQSGYGKRVLRWQTSLLSREGVVAVEVNSSESSAVARQSIFVPFQNPLTLVYEKNPFYGTLFENAIFEFNLTKAEANFELVPYFFNKEDVYLGRGKYTWTMNGSKINVPSNQKTMTFRNENNDKGVANIKVITGNTTMLQSDSVEFNINF